MTERVDFQHAAEIVIDLPRYLAEARLKRGWSQTEIAQYAGCSRNTITDFETGKRKIAYDLAARLLQWIAEADPASVSES